MTKYLQTLASAAALATALGTPAAAQEPPGSPFPVTPAQPVAKNLVALKVQVVVSRYQGEKKIGSLPYTLSVNNDHMLSRLRMGSRVAVLSFPKSPAAAEDKSGLVRPFTYQDVGTNIDCFALSTDDGRFRIEITIQDTSVYRTRRPIRKASHRRSRTYPHSAHSHHATLILRDGQTTQFTTATDRVSGEVTKVDVTLTVVK